MIRHYTTITAVSLVVLGALIYGFYAVGTPGESRAREFDGTRVSNITGLKTQVESYYRQNGKLPSTLNDLSNLSYSYAKTKDPETNEKYEYAKTGLTTYKICATFSTASDKQKDPYSYYNKEFNHPKGYHCFNLEVSLSSSITNKTSTTLILDKNVKSVSTKSAKVKFSKFPNGFFTSDTSNDWGLVTYSDDPVTVAVSFKEPVKLKSILNRFTHCTVKNCYTWNAEGVTADGTTVRLVENTDTVAKNSYVESRVKIDSDEKFDKVNITVISNEPNSQYIYWQKITFEYEEEDKDI